ncbi:hypothetical protein Curi_c01630 [Gottschalkia acidurici 9a]|uniref:Uncharacterized protein n=1 Tax=Gottschalkia acidurici (strain ATCC 7906 / DSM 604 / BCRC 14475 / CIP 104303 / KCTC 5404 / NCIMB 10678 / 9a) TaxID=1128398 RepID=K0ATR3_GOTA9|nr:hypothetical protein [Gottschalkia acidurici]AFS77243.1 hypothetical protein Curi_c01630 [Gottschalkia acidurici 9a]
MAGLILEGVCTSGKSTILKYISNNERYIRMETKIQLNEFMTERVIEYPRPKIEERIKLLQNYVEIIDNLNSNFYNSRFKRIQQSEVKPCYLLERFHLTHSVEELNFLPFKDIDKKLNELNFKLVILTIDENIISKRLEDSFKRRNNSWYRYIMSFEGIEYASEKYKNMQEKLVEHSKLSVLDTKIINTSKCNWQEYTNEILDFWMS